jgi:hypothetical protein
MGTDKVVFVEDPDDLTIAHAQPEVTSPETALTGSHGSDRMRVRGFLLIFFTFEPSLFFILVFYSRFCIYFLCSIYLKPLQLLIFMFCYIMPFVDYIKY